MKATHYNFQPVHGFWLALIWMLVILGGSLWAQDDPIAKLGLRVTKGAAAEYVDDKACASCHYEIFQSYQHVGMAQSFKKPENARVIEKFGKEFYHEASQRYYKILRKNGELVFQRYNRDAEGHPINVFEEVIDWVLGSGNRARSYLYQTAWGEMYTLPLGWYSEINDWGMSPGFESKNHPGVLRQVKRECMFCHNAYPEVAKGSDHYWEPALFPKDLPEGTGCQRCHGPGAGHIRAFISGEGLEAARAKIVNPAKLKPLERDSVCFQCHMLPAVSVIGTRRFDKPDYSFRPGQDLSKYLVHMETHDEKLAKEDFFEINHHGYRFYSSDCYQKSQGELACISCHDPHVKPASKAFRAKVDQVCSSCHPEPASKHPFKLEAGKDCASCHMPTRRSQDVILTTMTDHRIAKGPFDHQALVAPMEKQLPAVANVTTLPFGHPPKGVENDIYRMVAYLRALPDQAMGERLKGVLYQSKYPNFMPFMAVAQTQANIGQYAELEQMTQLLLRNDPRNFKALEWLGTAKMGQGKAEEAIPAFKKALELREDPSAYYNLGLAYFSLKRDAEAQRSFEKAIALRPNIERAHAYLGRIFERAKQYEKAVKAYRRSLEIEPASDPTYRDLVILLRNMGKPKEAERYLAVGLKLAKEPASLRQLVQKQDQ